MILSDNLTYRKEKRVLMANSKFKTNDSKGFLPL